MDAWVVICDWLQSQFIPKVFMAISSSQMTSIWDFSLIEISSFVLYIVNMLNFQMVVGESPPQNTTHKIPAFLYVCLLFHHSPYPQLYRFLSIVDCSIWCLNRSPVYRKLVLVSRWDVSMRSMQVKAKGKQPLYWA